jgi:hypothetical protein
MQLGLDFNITALDVKATLINASRPVQGTGLMHDSFLGALQHPFPPHF